MITTHHRMKERLKIIKEAEGDLTLRIQRVTDGYLFNPGTSTFEVLTGDLDDYEISLDDYYEDGLKTITLLTLPTVAQDLLFIFTDTVGGTPTTSFERHVFGGVDFTDSPSTCLVFGTLIDVSGNPLSGQKVEAYLNRAGYFSHKAGLIGYAATTLTDESGYFALPLIRGIDVTINVPVTGFSTRGYVPNSTSVELTSQALLSYQPGI